MAEGGALVPPVVVTLRAKAGELFSEFGRIKEEIKKLDAETEGGLTRGQRAMHGMEQAGRRLTLGLAGAALGGGAAALKLAGDFQESTTQLVTGAGESESQIDKVRKGLLAMAPAVAQGPDALAKGMYLIESAGYHGARGLMVMKAAAEGAKVGAADTATVADALTTAMTDYHLNASQAATVTSKLVATVASGKTTMQDLAGSLHNVTEKAGAAGVNLDQVLGALGTMTAQGISADQASQDLAHTIQSLQNPTMLQTKEMQELGLRSSDVSLNLGKRGLTGTLGMLEGALAKHLHAGQVWLSTYNNLQEETSKVNVMLGALPPSLRSVAKEYANGSITTKAWRKELMHLNVNQALIMRQFGAAVNRTRGFNSELTKGGPSAQTFGAALSKLTGGATGMNVALALGGANAKTFAANVKNISGTTADAHGNVKGFADASKDFNFQMHALIASAQAFAIKVGDVLIPIVLDAVHWFGKHRTAVIALAGVVGGLMVLAIGAYALKLARAVKETVTSYGRMSKHAFTWAKHTTKSVIDVVKSYAAQVKAKMSSASATSEADARISASQQRAASIADEAAAQQAQAAQLVAESQAAMATAAGESATAQEAAATGVIAAEDEVAATSEATSVATSAAFGPIGLAIMALVAVVTLLVTHWKQAWKFIKEAARIAWDDVLRPVFRWIVDIGLAPLRFEIMLLERVWSTSLSVIKHVTSGAWGVLKAIFGFINRWGIQPIKMAIHEFGQIWDDIWNGVKTAVMDAWNYIKPIVNTIKNAVGGVTHVVGSIVHGVGSVVSHLNPLSWDVGGWVPGAAGRPVPGVVHGGEFVLSTAMLAGRQAIPGNVAAAVLGNAGMNRGTCRSIDRYARPGHGASTAHLIGEVGGAPSGGGGGTTVVVQGSVIDLQGLFRAMQTAALRHGAQNNATWASFKRG